MAMIMRFRNLDDASGQLGDLGDEHFNIETVSIGPAKGYIYKLTPKGMPGKYAVSIFGSDRGPGGFSVSISLLRGIGGVLETIAVLRPMTLSFDP